MQGKNETFFFFLTGTYLLAAPGLSCGMWDLHSSLPHGGSLVALVESCSLTRDLTWVPCIQSSESQPLDHQGSPMMLSFLNQCNIINIYTIFTQQQDTNSIQVPINYKPGDTRTYPGTYNKMQKCCGLNVLKSYRICSLISMGLCQKSIPKIFETNSYIFKCSVTVNKRAL